MDIDLAAFERFTRVFQPGEIIFSEFEPGSTFYLIKSGRVQLLKSTGETERTLDILQPSEMFGEMAILERSTRSATAVAMDEVTVLELSAHDFEILILGNAQIAFRLLKVFARRIYDAKRRYMIMTLPDAKAKVADVFLMLDETQPNIDKSDISREFQTNIDEVAHWAGLGIEETTDVINHFIRHGRLELYEDRMVIKNIGELTRLVNSKRTLG